MSAQKRLVVMKSLAAQGIAARRKVDPTLLDFAKPKLVTARQHSIVRDGSLETVQMDQHDD